MVCPEVVGIAFRHSTSGAIHRPAISGCAGQPHMSAVQDNNTNHESADHITGRCKSCHKVNNQRFLTPGHQGWNDLHRLCRIGMEYYLPNNDNNDNDNDNDNNKTIIIRMMTMMIIGTTTIMIMIIIITTTLTMTIMKMIMIKTAQTPCQSLYKDRRIQNKIAWYNWYNRDDVMLILYEMLHTCSIMHTQWRCKFENTKHRCLRMFLHRCNLHCSGRN